jgi:pilus assembly protein CpaC
MVDNNYVRILAEPSLVALSGEEASFLAGGEFPIPVPQSGGAGAGGGSTAITIEYKEFGVRLSFRPTVLGDGKIRLKIAPEVSELSDVGALAVPGTSSTVPAIRTRRAETTVEMNSGQTFAMAGLLQNRVNASASKIPGMGQLPVIGALFRSVRYERNETELLVLATVELVEPLSIDQDRPVPGDQHIEPSDWELYSQGRLHGERKAPVSPSQSQTLKEMGLDDLRGPGAWDRHDLPPAPSRAVRTRPGTPVNGAASGTDTTETEEGHD